MGLEEGYAAAARAADHADRVHPTPLWTKLVWVRFLEYVEALKRSDPAPTFTTERFRAWCATHSLPDPPDARAFGHITRRASKKNIIFDTEKRVKEGSHGREVVLWGVV